MLKLLIVDDEPTIRQGIRESIDWENQGVRIVGEAANGQKGMEAVRGLSPDIVLVDIVMPRKDGLSFCVECRREFPRIRLIIVSGYDEFSLAQKAIRIGVDDYLLKPVGAEQLIEAVSKVGRSLMKQEFSDIKERLTRALFAPANAGNGSARRIIATVMDFIESRYLSELDLASAGQAAGVTPNHLCKVIRACCDVTFVEIVNRYRVEVAEIYLRSGNMKLYDVADRSGFSDSHYFARVFKKITGLTPGEFRDAQPGEVGAPAPPHDNSGHHLIT